MIPNILIAKILTTNFISSHPNPRAPPSAAAPPGKSVLRSAPSSRQGFGFLAMGGLLAGPATRSLGGGLQKDMSITSQAAELAAAISEEELFAAARGDSVVDAIAEDEVVAYGQTLSGFSQASTVGPSDGIAATTAAVHPPAAAPPPAAMSFAARTGMSMRAGGGHQRGGVRARKCSVVNGIGVVEAAMARKLGENLRKELDKTLAGVSEEDSATLQRGGKDGPQVNASLAKIPTPGGQIESGNNGGPQRSPTAQFLSVMTGQGKRGSRLATGPLSFRTGAGQPAVTEEQTVERLTAAKLAQLTRQPVIHGGAVASRSMKGAVQVGRSEIF